MTAEGQALSGMNKPSIHKLQSLNASDVMTEHQNRSVLLRIANLIVPLVQQSLCII